LAESSTDLKLLDLLCLTMVPGVGPHTTRALIERFGSAGAVLAAPRAELAATTGVGPQLAGRIERARAEVDAHAELALCRECQARLIARDDPDYPPSLLNIPDPPYLLYLKGALQAKDQIAIAVVGSRRSSPYGIRVAERLAAALARTGVTVVSGLARGIDAAAHRGALKAGGRSIAVLANGLATVYPPEHDELAHSLAESGGLISEMPLRQSPLAGLFTQRNRLIAGISLGVVVVEATARSGSLSTARHALEQNREVFAVPGPVDSLTSRGCHRLIKDGARLVETVDDILEELGPLIGEVRTDPGEPPVRHPAELALTVDERALLGSLGDQATGVDELIVQTGMTAGQVLATLSVLEVKRLVKRVPGGRFFRA
jgi:DNA processing protein